MKKEIIIISIIVLVVLSGAIAYEVGKEYIDHKDELEIEQEDIAGKAVDPLFKKSYEKFEDNGETLK